MDKQESKPGYKSFPKGDARRYFTALLAADRLKGQATIHSIAKEISCTRAESQRAMEAAAQQFGVVYQRDGSSYLILSWGVLKKAELIKLIASV